MRNFGMAPVRTASESVYETLVRAIVKGRLEPNEALSDRALALQLGVSRTPVREAFHQLEAAGLVRRRGRIGWVVTALDRQDVEELIELRTILEVAGIQRIVAWDESELARLAALFDGFTLPLPEESIARYLEVDNELHLALVNATGNRRIIDIYRYVEWHIDRLRHLVSYRVQRRVGRSLEEHRRICRALKARDAEAAADALTEHLVNVEKSFLELLEQAVAADGREEPGET